MKFKSRKDFLFIVIIFGLNTFLIGITVYGHITGEIEPKEYWTSAVIFALVGFVFWIFFTTNYELNQTHFIYRSGPFRGKIKIESIRKIEAGKTMWVGFKPATARKGLIVHYDKFNEIYISPKTNEAFIQKILELNNTIEIET
ncbi:Protein of unknown function (DUF1200) [Aequorivita sublithincola DSM 14238]|uniref:Uncharacterized protein YyaB-like PH domain-containing protein n=1 Tax=Aequorivita sublithincola (strain DSM 14238 / LMG 21431 / ACAM 643 / 9-3) TaxID=746697 RepID=I3YWT3_AEQSU|nr:PH domain-containing protein [Aequorivita sublithincola]AFL81451.1 Protein of unknown function (DUF1200) [Aequorivita sublithincola DSM 14238]